MTPQAAHLLTEALKLSELERGDLAARLLDSLDPTVDSDTESAWASEIQLRKEELQQGHVQPIPWPEAHRLILL